MINRTCRQEEIKTAPPSPLLPLPRRNYLFSGLPLLILTMAFAGILIAALGSRIGFEMRRWLRWEELQLPVKAEKRRKKALDENRGRISILPLAFSIHTLRIQNLNLINLMIQSSSIFHYIPC